MYRGRFAPTPSGELHLGSLVTAVASYLDARAAGGDWLVRIEDVDTQRCRAQFESAILFELERHGLEWDGVVVRQSERSELYVQALKDLRAAGRIFLCRCTRSSLERRRCSVNSEGEFIYPGYCRENNVILDEQLESFKSEFSLRFFVDETCATSFFDAKHGHQESWVSQDVGDFVLRRNDGCFAYQLAVVVDDYLQGITHVVRGSDILSLTARQVLLQNALGFHVPFYAHIPLVYSENGTKLSKSLSAKALKLSDARSNLHLALKHLGLHLDSNQNLSPSEILSLALEHWTPLFQV